MIDLAYAVGTLGFFALMLGYVTACRRLGGEAQRDEQQVRETERP